MVNRARRTGGVLVTATALACSPTARPSPQTPPAAATASTTTADHPRSSATFTVPVDARISPSGLRYLGMSRGPRTEALARFQDSVTLQYSVHDATGREIDRTEPGTPKTIALRSLPPGWIEGLSRVLPGDRMRLWVPPELAHVYGQPVREGEVQVDLELVAIERGPPSDPPLAAPPGVEWTKSGIAYRVLEHGQGASVPSGEDALVVMHYRAWKSTGPLQSNTYESFAPLISRRHDLAAGVREVLSTRVVGDKIQAWIPAKLMHGDDERGDDVFEIELLAVGDAVRDPDMHVVPFAAPPREARRTDSGIHHLVVRKGASARHPNHGDRVEIQFVEWMVDGRQRRSSYEKQVNLIFVLEPKGIGGWEECLPLMSVGEKARFWIPAAYSEGAPEPGARVFDMVLVAIHE